jgi:hypothetical protein
MISSSSSSNIDKVFWALKDYLFSRDAGAGCSFTSYRFSSSLCYFVYSSIGSSYFCSGFSMIGSSASISKSNIESFKDIGILGSAITCVDGYLIGNLAYDY